MGTLSKRKSKQEKDTQREREKEREREREKERAKEEDSSLIYLISCLHYQVHHSFHFCSTRSTRENSDTS